MTTRTMPPLRVKMPRSPGLISLPMGGEAIGRSGQNTVTGPYPSVLFMILRRMSSEDGYGHTSPNSASEVSGSSFLLAMAGEWQEGLALIERACGESPLPGWYDFIPFMDHYDRAA